MAAMSSLSATIIFSDGPYKNRIFALTDPTNPLPPEVLVTDGGNTIENTKHKIVGHYIGMYDPLLEGELPDPEDLPPC